MDEPIFHKNRKSPNEEPLDLYERLCYALLDDNKDEFLRHIEDPGFEELSHGFDAARIFLNDAVNIGITVLNGELEGIIDIEDVLEDEMTPLHLAALKGAPRLTKYLLGRGDNVDVMCDYEYLGLKQVTPIDLVVEAVDTDYPLRVTPPELRHPWNPRKSIFELLYYVSHAKRRSLEVLRLLVQKTKNTERVRKAFIDYAEKGQLVQLTALFLAVPELFLSPRFGSLGGGLSSFSMLYFLLNSLKKRTDLGQGILLLLDVFATVGHKLVAFIRLEDRDVLENNGCNQMCKIAFLLREVAQKKLGVSSRDDYFLSFFRPLRPYVNRGPHPSDPYFPCNTAFVEAGLIPCPMKKNEIDIDYIDWLAPDLETREAAILNKAIKDKLSSMPTLYGRFKTIRKISKKEEKHLPRVFSFFNCEPSVRSFHTITASAKPITDFTLTPSNKVVMPTQFKQLFPLVNQSHLSIIAKRMIRGGQFVLKTL